MCSPNPNHNPNPNPNPNPDPDPDPKFIPNNDRTSERGNNAEKQHNPLNLESQENIEEANNNNTDELSRIYCG